MQASSSRPRVRHQLRRKGLLGITPRDQKGLGRTWSAASSRVLHYDARTCFSLISRGPYVVLWIGQIPVSHPILSEAKNQQRRGLQLYRHTLPPYSRARGELGIKVLRMTSCSQVDVIVCLDGDTATEFAPCSSFGKLEGKTPSKPAALRQPACTGSPERVVRS